MHISVFVKFTNIAVWYTVNTLVKISSNNVKPLLGTRTYSRQAAAILVKINSKKGCGCNQYITTKKFT